MFKIGDYVVYGSTGICRIEDITHLDIGVGNSDKLYYVLVPGDGRGGRSFLPVDNTKVVLRAVISREEALELIDKIPQIERIGVGNDKQREEKYKELARQCDCESWVTIIKTIYVRRQERIAQGKKITATDDKYCRIAEDSLYSELGFAMGKNKDEMEVFIRERIDGNREPA